MRNLALYLLVDVIVNVTVCSSLLKNLIAELNRLTHDCWELFVETRSFLDRLSVLLEVGQFFGKLKQGGRISIIIDPFDAFANFQHKLLANGFLSKRYPGASIRQIALESITQSLKIVAGSLDQKELVVVDTEGIFSVFVRLSLVWSECI